jgi:integrase
MSKLRLTKTVADSAAPEAKDYEIRDTAIPGFLLKVTPAGRKMFMVAYTASNGQRRKPAIGRYGAITVEQARSIAQDWLAEVRRGGDPSADRSAARQAPTMKALCDRFINEYSLARNKPSTVEGNRSYIRTHILPAFGRMKVPDLTRADVAKLMARLEDRPSAANHTLSCLRKMFNMAEVWGYRPDGSNPCRHVQKYPERGTTRLIRDGELRKLFDYLDRADREGLEHPFITLAIRLQFEFAARRSEILALEWDWVDFENRRVVWPDSKTGGMSKPLGAEAYRLLDAAPRLEDSPYVVPSIFNPRKPMPKHTYSSGWRRIVQRAGIPHCGTHAVRHRAATDIANSGVPVKVGMALTAHKTVSMFMRYVHTEDDPVRAAADAVAARRRGLVGTAPVPAMPPAEEFTAPPVVAPARAKPDTPAPPPLGLEDSSYTSRTKVGNYRPYRKRSGLNRASPPKTTASEPAGREAEHS